MLSSPPHKGVLQVLAFFNTHHRGRCTEVARVTGLPPRTASRRLNELAKAGIIDIIPTKTFPPLRQYNLPETSREVARAAASLLQKLRS